MFIERRFFFSKWIITCSLKIQVTNYYLYMYIDLSERHSDLRVMHLDGNVSGKIDSPW